MREKSILTVPVYFYDETLETDDGADGNAAGHMTDAEECYSVDMDAISSENAQKKVSLKDIALKSTFFNNIELQVVKQHSSPISPPPFYGRYGRSRGGYRDRQCGCPGLCGGC